MALIVARRGHGKTTKLLEAVPALAEARSYTLWESGFFPLQKKPSIIVYDPKHELQRKFKRAVPGWDIVDAASAGDAALLSLDADERSIVVIEELLTIKPIEFDMIDHAISISRRGTDGRGPVIVGTTQRPYKLPLTFRALADAWLLGKLTEPRDIKAVEEVLGGVIARTVPTLGIMEFVSVAL